MIPKKLTIKGLYSYQDSQVIDFTQLASDSLFGIFGPVGSGKSAILEAITFAIYLKTDRLNERDQRSYNMMNLRSDEMLIEFIFKAGIERSTYKVVVKSTRKKKKFNQIDMVLRQGYREEDGNLTPVDFSEIEKAVGLSYENFKRTIIIPQGKFKEFLELGSKDRTIMMKELFGLEKYDLSPKISILESANNKLIENIGGKLQQLGDIHPEQKQEYEDQAAQLVEEIRLSSAELARLQGEDMQMSQLKKLAEKLTASQLKLNQLIEQEPGFNLLAERIGQYELCQSRFKNLIESLNRSTSRILQTEQQMKSELVKLALSQAEIERLGKTLATILPAYEKRESLTSLSIEMDNVLKIRGLERLVQLNRNSLKQAKEILKITEDSLGTLKPKRDQLAQTITIKENSRPDLVFLATIRDWHTNNRNLKNQLINAKQKEDELLKANMTINELVSKKLQEPVFNSLPADSDIPAIRLFLVKEISAIRIRKEVLETEADHYRLQKKLESFVNTIVAGEPCPLCGSIDHPKTMNIANVDNALGEIVQKKAGMDKEILEKGNIITEFDKLESRLQINAEQLAGYKVLKDDLNQQIAGLALAYVWEVEYLEEKAVADAFKASELLENELRALRIELATLSQELEEKMKSKDIGILEKQEIEGKLKEGVIAIKTLTEGLLQSKPEDFTELLDDQIIVKKLDLLKERQKLEQEYRSSTDSLLQFQKELARLTGSTEAMKTILVQEKENNQSILEQIKSALEKSQYNNVSEVEIILSQALDLVVEKARLEHFRRDLGLAQNETKNLLIEIGDQTYDNKIHEKIAGEIERIKGAVNDKNQELGRITELIKILAENLIALQALLENKGTLEIRAENIKTMKKLFSANGFVDYVSTVYLQNLCKAANERFAILTRQNLSLELTGDNDFQIRDFINGGELRSVKTLSGGQTFQASLSLALALSDNVQHLARADQNFFFLDEGFGSLDREALAIVFETLKTLRKENRIVGLISHVEEMQQEIINYLKISNDPVKGSQIQRSWEN